MIKNLFKIISIGLKLMMAIGSIAGLPHVAYFWR